MIVAKHQRESAEEEVKNAEKDGRINVEDETHGLEDEQLEGSEKREADCVTDGLFRLLDGCLPPVISCFLPLLDCFLLQHRGICPSCKSVMFSLCHLIFDMAERKLTERFRYKQHNGSQQSSCRNE